MGISEMRMENCITTYFSLVFLVIASQAASSMAENDPIFIVLMTDHDASASKFVLHDMYCLDPVLPTTDAACNYRVLAPVDGYFTDTRIEGMSIDFEHPSKGTKCQIEWKENTVNVEVTCAKGKSKYAQLPAFRSVNSTSGWVRARNLIISESSCLNKVYAKRYYKFGLNNYPEQRPTVVFRFKTYSCRAGAIFGRPNYYRTTEAPCRYNKRRRCRPVTKRQREDSSKVVHLSSK
ncbi:uncharacterized protein LOC124162688 [Ischnura elegans]|uniref:uncharacterized protein LOC124162688 n=1 Tax=Ischnura elegans TaxID=197161 RepID=UPI001ED875E8|nr:uncharacterized protein LOC124162688 [Ischnura elegans]